MSRKASRITAPDASLFCRRRFRRLLDDMNYAPLVPAPGCARVAAMTTPIPPLRLLVSFLLLAAAARAALPVPDADDGGISLPPGFRALVVADNLETVNVLLNTSQ